MQHGSDVKKCGLCREDEFNLKWASLSLSLHFSKSFLKRRLTNFSPVRSYLCPPPTKKSSPQLMSRSPWSPSLSSLLGLPSPSSPSPSSSSSSQIILPRNSFAAPPPPMPQCSHERSQTPHACPSVSLSLSPPLLHVHVTSHSLTDWGPESP